MKKIGILGGTFDPFHLGHVSIGERSIEEVGLDELILLPANVSPFKINCEMVEEIHRINMLEAFVKNHPDFSVSRLEIDTDNVSYTYDTMETFRKLYPDDKIYFICGSDALVTVENWYKGKMLLESTDFIVANRPGIDGDVLNEKIKHYVDSYLTEIILLTNPILEVSSTEIKEKLKLGMSIHNLVPGEIEKYINEYALYR